MSAEDIACCLDCQMTFGNHEELTVHSCHQIKAEENSQIRNFYDQENFKYELHPQDFAAMDSDYNQREMIRIKNKTQKKLIQVLQDSKRSAEKQKTKVVPKTYVKEEANELEHNKQLNSTYDSNLELSEEFIIFILRQIDELCDNIKNCDPDIERALDVNKNLSNAVSCYRDKLNPEPHFRTEFENEEQYIIDDVKQETNDKFLKHDTKDLESIPKKKLKKKRQLGFEKLLKNESKYIGSSSETPKMKIKKERKNEAFSDETWEKIKNQCGRHTASSLALLLGISKSTLYDRIQKEQVTFLKKDGQCDFCEMKKNTENDLESIPKKKLKKKRQLGFEKLLKNESKYIGSSSETPKMKIKKERKNEAFSDETWEKIKNQCGRHTASSLALLLGISKSTLYDRIQKEQVTFLKKDGQCDFCEMKKNTENVFDDQLFPFLRFDNEKDEFGCTLCNYHGRHRKTLLKHIKTAHRNNIGANRTKGTKENLDCGKSMCFKLYGDNAGRKFWCTKCAEDFKKNPIPKIQKPKYIPKMKVCPECGISTINLGRVSERMSCKE